MQFTSIFKFTAYTAVFLFTDVMAVSASVTGINCKGSIRCGEVANNAAYELNGHIQRIPDDKWFNNGQHIACIAKGTTRSGVCAFLRNTGGAHGKRIKQLSPYIVQHGCSKCGTVPYYFPEGNNNVKDGALSFDFIAGDICTGPGGSGLC